MSCIVERVQPTSPAQIAFGAIVSQKISLFRSPVTTSSKPRELETAGLQPLRRKQVAPRGGITHSGWATLAHPFGFCYSVLMTGPRSTRTVCCKLVVDAAADAALRQTQAVFNAAASYCARVAW